MKKFIILFILPLFSISQVDYNLQIQPIFNTNCVSCHQGSANYFGGLSLESYEAVTAGGNTEGGIISTGLLENYISTGYMPPYGSGAYLNTNEVDLIIQWLTEGALEEVDVSSTLENNKEESIVKIIDVLGRNKLKGNSGVQIYIYENGKIEKKFNTTNYIH
tara:strand:- start:311 stop:796 length:486 start_codon:yes stop_codon:yes gene_type:complete